MPPRLAQLRAITFAFVAAIVFGRAGFAGDTVLENFEIGPDVATINLIHNPGSVSPELNGLLNKLPNQTLAGEIRTAVNAGTLCIGTTRAPLGRSGFGVHDFNTIGLDLSKLGDLSSVAAIAHEFAHVLNALASGAVNDPTTQGPCGALAHYEMCNDSLDLLCLMLGELGSGASLDQGCADFRNIQNTATDLYLAADAAFFEGLCPTPPASINSSGSCPACQ